LVKIAKADLQATGCAGGSSISAYPLRDQIESEVSRSCGSTTLFSAVPARVSQVIAAALRTGQRTSA
jgi:hypothetical protein